MPPSRSQLWLVAAGLPLFTLPPRALAEEWHKLGVNRGAPLRVNLPKVVRTRWSRMCDIEGTSHAEALQDWVETRWDMLQEAPEDVVAVHSGAAAPSSAEPGGDGSSSSSSSSRASPSSAAALAAAPAAAGVETHDGAPLPGVPVVEASADAACSRYLAAPPTLDSAFELLGAAGTELVCPQEFMRAVMLQGRRHLDAQTLLEYDIMHEVIRAETGYRLARLNGVGFDDALFLSFMRLQEELAHQLQGWRLWEYEFAHWRYYRRPTVSDEYSQLYSGHRPPEMQHLECPAIPLAYRLWDNFPTCPPSRLRDLPRFFDAYVSAMTVDNWRASYKDFLSEGYNYNVSIFAGGDPTLRLSKGAHSVFAGVFLQKFPTDLWCYQQVIHDMRPQYIIDLGSSQGGSAVWFASMLKLFEIPGKVITIDLAQEQAYWLTSKRAKDAARRLRVENMIDWNYVVGGSKSEAVRQKVALLCASAPCMVISDSDHDYQHTFLELEWYSKHVGVGQYLVVEDTNIYGWSGWLNINDPNRDAAKKGPMEAANDFELGHRADFVRTDWCAKQYGLSQTPDGWFFRTANQDDERR